MRNYYDQADVSRLIEGLVGSVAAAFPPDRPLNVVGIRTRGEILAARIAAGLKERGHDQIGRGVLDVTLYRDDIAEIGPGPMVRTTQLDIDLDAKPLLLVDDVLFTGRSVRAAMNLLIDFGRPAAIRLAVMVDRGGRELPIQPDFAALTLSNVPGEHRVNVRLLEIDGVDQIVVEPRAEVA
jgi:pyrimidine operon attenuation protein / uracil phosphoribosyltransferase